MKKFSVALLTVFMVLGLTACGGSSDGGSTSETKKSVSKSELGCEITDYMFTNSIDKIGKFIEDNALEYNDESGYYENDYIAVYMNDTMTTIVSAAIINPGNYTIYNIDIGDEFDREIVTNRLNRNGMPLYTDEGNRVVYAASTTSEALYVRLNDDGTVAFVMYDLRGLEYFAGIGEEVYKEEIESSLSASDIYKDLSNKLFQDGSGITGSFTDKALTFIDNHPDLFIGNDPNNESAAYFNNNAFEYKKFIKSAENYPLSMIELYDCGVIDIWEGDIDGSSVCMTYALVANYFYDEDIVYFVFAPGSFEIYNDDEVSITGIPLGNGSYEDASGGTTKCIFIASTSMNLFDDGYDDYGANRGIGDYMP